MTFIKIKNIIYFSSLYEFFYSHIKDNEIKMLLNEFNLFKENKTKDEIVDELLNHGITDEEAISFVLENREKKYLLNYNDRQEQFEMIEIEK